MARFYSDMQTLTAIFSQSVDPAAIMSSWAVEAKVNAAPHVDFAFSGNRVDIKICSDPNAPWEIENFRRAFTIAVGRVATACEFKLMKIPIQELSGADAQCNSLANEGQDFMPIVG